MFNHNRIMQELEWQKEINEQHRKQMDALMKYFNLEWEYQPEIVVVSKKKMKNEKS